MFVARWQIDVRFGHKQDAIELMREWERTVGEEAGIAKHQHQMLSGSIGAREATIEESMRFESLAELEEFFARLAKNKAHAEWGKKLEPYVVSGTSYWQVFREL